MESAKLGDVFEIARGGSPRPIDDYITKDPNGINWIMIGDATEKYITRTKKKIRKEGVSKSRVVNPGDFLLTNSMSFGRPYILKTSGCIHDGWLVLSPKQQISTDFFYHLLGSDLVYQQFVQRAAGAVVKNLNIDLVRSVAVPLPPFSEQKRIAAILDKAADIRRKRQQAIELTDQLLRSVFLDMFGDPVINPRGITLGPMTDVFDIKTGKLDSNAAVLGGKYPFFTCAKEVGEIDSFAFDQEALLLAGNNAQGEYDVKHYKGKFNAYQRTYVLTLKQEHDSYAFYQAALEYQLQNLQRFSRGTNTKYITLEIMRRTMLPRPNVAEQKTFSKLCSKIRDTRSQLTKSELLCEALNDSLAQVAFQGNSLSSNRPTVAS